MNWLICTSLDPFERNSATLWLFSIGGLMHPKHLVELCIVFGAAQLENIIGVINLHHAPERFSRT